MVLPRPLPTPVLAYAIRQLGCAAGVMVTAIAQPAAGQRLQGVPRQRVADRAAGGRGDLRRRSTRSARSRRSRAATTGRRWATRSSTTTSSARAALVDPLEQRDLRVVYTPMHGVGRDVVLAVFERGGFPPLMVVPRQGEPDPDFPTVAFPNPEEPGAMDLAMAAARESAAGPGHRERPGRRPLRRRRARPATATTGCCAGTTSARCSALHMIRRGRARDVRLLDRVVVAAVEDRRGRRARRSPRR